MANWSRKVLGKSKKVIFRSKPSQPEPLSLLVCFLKKSRFHFSCRPDLIFQNPKKSFFSIFTPNPIIHYTKSQIIVTNWSRKVLGKSKKVIFWLKSPGIEQQRLLVRFLRKSGFHVSCRPDLMFQKPQKIIFFDFHP